MSARVQPSRRRLSLRESLATHLLLEAADRIACGTLDLTLPDGHTRTFTGEAPGPRAALEVRDMRVLSRALARGDVGFAEAWMDGAVHAPDLEALLELGALNEDLIARGFRDRTLFRLARRALHWARRNSRRGSRRNIAYHYDLGNDFYRHWLDAGMNYSCALFEDTRVSLEQAQEAKHRRLLDLLDLRPGAHLLEIGCGWGGFAELAAVERGCRVTGLTLSRAQYDHARARIERAGLADRVEILLEDYRDVSGRYDHVVSIEMFEAVGESYWDTWFGTVARSLRPGGRAVVQVITIDDAVFPRYRTGTDFIQRHIFPGGMLPSPSMFRERAAAAGLATTSQEFFGAHYARTLEQWHCRVLGARTAIRGLGFDERFLRMWRYYLAYCRAGFVTGRVNLMQTVLAA